MSLVAPHPPGRHAHGRLSAPAGDGGPDPEEAVDVLLRDLRSSRRG